VIIGIPKEIKNNEFRVSATASSVHAYVSAGHSVLVEKNAGLGSGISNEDYIKAGAQIIETADELWQKADLIQKVKEPIEAEYKRMRKGQILYTYLHLAANKACTQAVMDSGITAIAYETVEVDGQLPLLAPMSEVAGRMSIQVGAAALEASKGGAGVLLGGVPGVRPGKVVVIGAVLVHGAKAPKLVSNALVKKMKPGAVLVDVAIDQGGCFEDSKATTHQDPTYKVHDAIFYCVANMPGAVPATSTYALANATIKYGLALANKGWQKALADDANLAKGLNVHEGKIMYEAVAMAHNL
jgi:alanine dehydrogenase